MTDAGMNEEQIAQLEAFKIVEAVGGSSAITALGPYIRRMELPLLDYMTIRDLLELGGCQGDAGIVVVLMAMFAGLQEGSICLNLDKGPFLNRLPVDAGKNADALWGDFLSGLREGRRHRLITRNPGEYMPLILDESSGRSLLYFQKYHAHEKRLKDRMEAFLNADVSLPLHSQQIDAFLGEIYSDPLVIRANHTPLARDPLQLEAIRLALTSQFSIISGGPGTGKTSLVVNILRCLVRAGVQAPQIVLGAPTGRAAQRMTEMVQKNISAIRQPSRLDSTILDLKGSTLHKILPHNPQRHAGSCIDFGRRNVQDYRTRQRFLYIQRQRIADLSIGIDDRYRNNSRNSNTDRRI